ncbi:ABC transporter permease [Amycolatopsis pigmentata]|uniref:ABC transporter permease n=1 Tax=Amycolatopsis pigmentata TaxID=450801 RepID=A0ABW5G516_9PSEU
MSAREVVGITRRIPAPYWLTSSFLIALVLAPAFGGTALSAVNFFNIGQTFAAYGPLALGLGLLMVAGEFDLSLPAIYGLGAMIAVQTGQANPWAGLALAVTAAAAIGLVNGFLVAAAKLNSVPVTLGAFIVVSGLILVLGGGKSVPYENYTVGLRLDEPIAGLASIRSLVAVGLFVATGLLVRGTRWGRDLKATGGDRRAAEVAGVRTQRILIETFGLSAGLAGLSGALLGYGLSSANPAYGGFSSLIFAATAVLLGGVRLAGGEGSAAGMAAGVFSMALLEELLVVTEAQSYVQDLLTGGLLVLIGIAVSPHLLRQARARGRVTNPTKSRRRRTPINLAG